MGGVLGGVGGAAHAGDGVGDLHRLVDAVGGEGDGPDAGLGDEPPEVLAPVDGVDAPDEEAPEEEGEDAHADADAAAALAEVGVAQPGEKKREDEGDRLESVGVSRGGFGHERGLGGGGAVGRNRGCRGGLCEACRGVGKGRVRGDRGGVTGAQGEPGLTASACCV